MLVPWLCLNPAHHSMQRSHRCAVLCSSWQVLRSGFTERGLGSVQDEATGLVVQMLDPQPGEVLLDACAAPGGKALYAAARMEGKVCAWCGPACGQVWQAQEPGRRGLLQ
jgi:16S rRNA C967 or C1407 C5-methylase (RsmB/RsmF family)